MGIQTTEQWIPAFAGMTGVEFVTGSVSHRKATLNCCKNRDGAIERWTDLSPLTSLTQHRWNATFCLRSYGASRFGRKPDPRSVGAYPPGAAARGAGAAGCQCTPPGDRVRQA